MNSGIYTITNKMNGHRYVGSAVDLEKRFRDHRNHLRNQTHCNAYLQNAWNKYDEDVFLFEVLEEWEPEFLISMEQWWMNMLCPEYNIAPVAGSQLGIKLGPFSDEHRAKLSAALEGRKFSDEHRAKLSTAFKGMQRSLGRKLSDETKAKISVANKGRKHTDEAKAKIGTAGKGRKHSKESRAKMSLVQRGHEVSKETRAKLRAAMTGKKHSKESRAKMSVARLGNQNCLGYKHTDEAKANMSASQFGNHSGCKLTESQVREIRHLLALGDMTQKEIAGYYPVTRTSICHIKTGRTYADL